MISRGLDLAEILTIGLTFGVIKILGGEELLRGGHAVGWLLVALGAVDLVLNAVNLVSVALRAGRVAPVCAFDALLGGRRPERPHARELALALDMMLAFIVVASMIGFGRVPGLPADERRLWSLASVLNVLGAGGTRLARAVERISVAAPSAGRRSAPP